jgi:predicted DNA-binding protein (MmcQ/YjbR family)
MFNLKSAFTFNEASELNFNFLCDQPGYRPAPYLASCGMKWIQQYDVPDTEDEELMYSLIDSHRILSLYSIRANFGTLMFTA